MDMLSGRSVCGSGSGDADRLDEEESLDCWAVAGTRSCVGRGGRSCDSDMLPAGRFDDRRRWCEGIDGLLEDMVW